MVTVAVFYHLTRSTNERILATILPRALAAGWRAMVRGGDPAALERLDGTLWQHPDDSFLPHGLQGGAQDRDQPILLGAGAITNGAQVLVLLDGASTTPAEARGLERVWVLFDGGDEAAVQDARGLWTLLTGAGCGAEYWAEDGGKWEKKMERPAAQ